MCLPNVSVINRLTLYYINYKNVKKILIFPLTKGVRDVKLRKVRET